MDHQIKELSALYESSIRLYNDAVKGKADSILNNLNGSINVLKNSWKGKDAGVQINNIVTVYNKMSVIRNALADLAKRSSMVAADYYELLRLNGASVPAAAPVSVDEEKTEMPEYEDVRDTIDITTEAVNGKSLLDSVIDQYDNFASAAFSYHDQIMGEWLKGPDREKTEGLFEDFRANAEKYKKVLVDVSESINTALKNYKM